MDYLPQEIINHIVGFIRFDLQTLTNIRQASIMFHYPTKHMYNIVQRYISIFDAPLIDEDSNLLLLNHMREHLIYLDSNNIPIEKAKEIDTFIKEHDNDIDSYIPAYFGNGEATLLLNYYREYNMVKYLLYLGANPNYTTTTSNYHIAIMINVHYDDIDEKAQLFALLINYGMDIDLTDYDVGQSLATFLEEDHVLRQKVLQILNS
jgi:hypothetical protein